MSDAVELEVGGRTVRLSSPDRVYFPDHGWTKLDVANYYIAVGDGIVRALRERPTMLHRFPKGLAGPKVHQKRLPDELCVKEVAQVVWAVQMSTVEFHPWNSRRADTEKPDEWRIDLDPMPACGFDKVRRVAGVVHEVLDELGVVGYPKTSGGSGLHVYVRIVPEWGHKDVRRAALAFAREVERRLPDDVTTTWWRKDRPDDVVFVDYNQNARDHTIASAWSLRGVAAGTVSTPIAWDEVADVEPQDFTLATVPARFARLGDLHATIDDVAHRLDTLLEWADRDGADLPESDDPTS